MRPPPNESTERRNEQKLSFTDPERNARKLTTPNDQFLRQCAQIDYARHSRLDATLTQTSVTLTV
jgi:hypothetical protein